MKHRLLNTLSALAPLAIAMFGAQAHGQVALQIAKTFGAQAIALNGTTNMVLTITNPNAALVTVITLTDTFPAGLVPSGVVTTTCAGAGATIVGQVFTVTSATVAAGGTCTFTIPVVTGTTSGVKTNNAGPIVTAIMSDGRGGFVPVPASNVATAIIVVASPLQITKTFGAQAIALNGTTNMVLTINNPNPFLVTVVTLTDTFPAGLVPSGVVTTTCAGAGSTIVGQVFTVTSATVAAGGACTFTIPVVTGATSGVKVNNAGPVVTAIMADGAGGFVAVPPSNVATATIAVAAPLAITKAFGAATIPLNGTTNMVLTINNPNPFLVTVVTLTDTFPAGLVPTGPATTTCAGAGSTIVGQVFTVTSATVAAAGNCTFTIAVVTGTTGGVKTNNAGPVVTAIMDNGAGGFVAVPPSNTATATITVVLPPTITKAFDAAVIPFNGISVLTFNIVNPNATVALNGVAVVDNLPAGLRVATPNGLVGNCGGVVTATAGSGQISLVGGVIAAAATCTFTVNVTGVAPGLQTNVTGNVTSANGGTDGTATAAITVGGQFLISYASNLTNGDSVIDLTNTGANGASVFGPGFGGAAGNICFNVYAFSPDEQLVSCCSCLVTPNGLASLSVNSDLISNTLTGVRPNSVVIKIVATGAGAGFNATSCTNSAAVAGNAANPLIVDGGLAFGTTIHPAGAGFATTENPFRTGSLSAQELASITSRCTNIVGNGSTFGICRSCRAGGLGATH